MHILVKNRTVLMGLMLLSVGLARAQSGDGTTGPSAQPLQSAAIPPLIAAGGQPQIAFHFLKDYADSQLEKDEKSRQLRGWIGLGIGGLVAVGGVGGLIWGPGLAGGSFAAGSLADFDLQADVTAFLAGDITCFAAGSMLAPDNRMKKYQLAASESDPVVREAMAASILKGFADEGKAARIRSGFLNIGLSVLIAGLSAGLEAAHGNPWYSGMANDPAIPLLSAASLLYGGYWLIGSSPDERRYQEYQAAHDAVYTLPGQGR
jgi:hypothetical protein